MILINYIGSIPEGVNRHIEVCEPEIMKDAIIISFTKIWPVAAGRELDRFNPLVLIYYTDKIEADKIRVTIQKTFAVDVVLVQMDYYEIPRDADGMKCDKP